jgi:hypothetical protein
VLRTDLETRQRPLQLCAQICVAKHNRDGEIETLLDGETGVWRRQAIGHLQDDRHRPGFLSGRCFPGAIHLLPA